MFDPHRRCFASKAGGLLHDMHAADVDGSGIPFCRKFEDQVAPFAGLSELFGWTVDSDGFGSWGEQGHGTLFRLPLRTPAQAARSKIKGGLKGGTYTDDDLRERIVGRFIADLSTRLLFMRFVELIEIWVWEADDAQPTLTHRTEIVYGDDEQRASTRARRVEVLEAVKGLMRTADPNKDVCDANGNALYAACVAVSGPLKLGVALTACCLSACPVLTHKPTARDSPRQT